jgi:hypothetical protein
MNYFINLPLVEIALIAMHLLTLFYVLASGAYAFGSKKPSAGARFMQFALSTWYKPGVMAYMVAVSVFSSWLWWYLDYAAVLKVSLVYFAFLYAAYMPVVYVLLRRAQQRAYLDRVVPSV